MTKFLLSLTTLGAMIFQLPLAQAAEPIVNQEKQFKIQPPDSWEVIENHPGVTLLMQIPKNPANPREYQRSIQVLYQSEIITVDEFERDHYAQIIAGRRKKAFGSGTDYQINAKQMITLANKQPAILYYTNPIPFMGQTLREAHVLVAAQNGHFLLTYTDIAENFEATDNASPLATAYAAMTSIQVTPPSGGRFDYLLYGGGGVLGVLGLFVLVRLMQRYRIHKYGTKQGYDHDIADLNTTSDISTMEESEIDPKSLGPKTYSTTNPITTSDYDSVATEYDDEEETTDPFDVPKAG